MRFLWLSALVVALDQASKAAVLQFLAPRGGMTQSIPLVGDWLRLTFTENPGMAFGLTRGPPGTGILLALIASCLVAGYIYRVRNGSAPYVWSLALIFGGAVGNIIDRVFYGVLLDYGTYFTGHVVDFIHVSRWKGFIPNAVPLIGGSYMELFPIWNVADMSIVIGVVGVLFFHRTFHEQRMEERSPETAPVEEESADDGPEWPSSTETDGQSSPSSPASGDSFQEDVPVSSDEDWPIGDRSDEK